MRISLNVLRASFLCLISCLLNTTAALAVIIPCGQTIYDSISIPGEQDTYTFTASANDKVTVRMAELSGDSELQLYGPDGVRLAYTDSSADSTLTLAGTYIIIMRGYSPTATTNYALSWQRLNNPANAATINPGTTITSSIARAGESDYYTFNASANDKVTVRMAELSGDSELQLYGPDGVRLAYTDSRVDKTLTLAGTYTIIVRGYRATTTSNYGLSYSKSNNPPATGSITPSSGTSQSDETIAFTTTFSDPDPAGWEDIQFASLLINTSIDGARCFFGYYNQNTNKLYLRNESNTSWLGGFAPGSNNIIENSYAKLDCAKTTVSGNNKTLSVNWSVVLKPSFGGRNYNTYLKAQDDSNVDSGWAQKGTWKVEMFEITLFLPADKSRFLENTHINCAAQVELANPLYQYQFLVDGKIRRPYSLSSSWDWLAQPQDVGTHTLTVQVKHPAGAQKEKSQRLIIYRRPIEP